MAGKQYAIQIKIDGDGKAAVTAINGVNRSLDDHQKRAKDAGSETSRLGAAFGRLSSSAGMLLGVGGLSGIAAAMVTISEESARLQRGFAAVTGSAEAANREMNYLMETSNRLGLEAQSAGKAYLSLSAAAKGTTLEGKASRDIFESVALAMGKLGKSSYDTEGALLAIEQMISKGNVQAEELRGQLGERLPGAFRIAAEAIGVTTQELDGMLSRGEVMAEDLLPKLAQRLNTLYDDGKAVTGLTAEWSRFTNQMRDFATEAAAASGAVGLLESALRGASGLLDDYRWAVEFARTGTNPDKTVAAIEAQSLGYEMLRQKADELYSFIIEKQTEITELSTRPSALEALFPKLAPAQAELRAAAQELGSVKQRLAEIDAQQEKTWASAAAGAAQASGAVSGWSQSMVEATARTLGWQSGVDGAVSRLNQAEPILRSAAKSAEIPEEVLLSVFAMENAFGRLITSAAGAKGPMQFIDTTAAAVAAQMNAAGVATGMTADKIQTDLTAALQAGAFHLADLSGQFDHFYQALIAYNAGPGKADLPFAKLPEETQEYVRNGIKLMEQYAAATGSLGAMSGELAAAQKYMAGEVDTAGRTVARAAQETEQAQQRASMAMDQSIAKAQQLTRQYIPGRAAAEDYADAQRALAVAVSAGAVTQKDATAVLEAMTAGQSRAAEQAEQDAETWGAIWESTVQRVDDAFSQMWVDLIDGTQSTLDTLRSGIKRWLAEVAHALITQPLVVGITAATSGTAAAGTAGTAQSALGLGQMFSSVAGGLSKFSGVLSGATGYAMNFGAALASGAGTAQAGMLAAQTGAFGAAGASATVGALGAGGVSMAAAAIPYVGIAVAIAGALAASGVFGGKKEDPRINLGVDQGNFKVNSTNGRWGETGDNGQLLAALDKMNVEMNTLARQFGSGALRELESFNHKGQALSKENFEQWLDDVAAGMLRAMAYGVRIDELEKAGQGVLGGIMTIALNAAAQDPAAMKAAADSAHELYAGFMDQVGALFANTGAGVFSDLENVSTQIWYVAQESIAAGKSVADALNGVISNLDAAAGAYMLVDESIDGMTIPALNAMGAKLSEAAGGYDKLTAGMTSYYDLFYSEEEKRANQIEIAQRRTSDALDQLGLAMPETEAGFRNLVGSLDLTSAQGQKAFAVLTGLSSSFKLLFDAMAAGGGEVADLIDQYLGQRTGLRDAAQKLSPASSPAQDDAASREALAAAGFTGEFSAAGIAEFLRAIAETEDAGGEAGKALLEMVDVLFKAAAEADRVAEERRSLQQRELELTGTAAEILAAKRAEELVAVDASNRALLERIHLLEDETKASGQRNDFLNWLDPARESKKALGDLESVFRSWGMQLPSTRAELQALVDSGAFTDAQLAILGLHLGALGDLFGKVAMSVDEAIKSISESIGGLRSSIEDFGLTDAERYDRSREEVDRLMGQLPGLTDPAEIAEMIKRITAEATAAWNLLTEDQKATNKDAFLAFLDKLEAYGVGKFDKDSLIPILGIERALNQVPIGVAESLLILSGGIENALNPIPGEVGNSLLMLSGDVQNGLWEISSELSGVSSAIGSLQAPVINVNVGQATTSLPRLPDLPPNPNDLTDRGGTPTARDRARGYFNQGGRWVPGDGSWSVDGLGASGGGGGGGGSSSANSALEEMSAVLEGIRSLLDERMPTTEEASRYSYEAARRQLDLWVKAGVIPDKDGFDKVVDALDQDSTSRYATKQDYVREYWETSSALREIERRAAKAEKKPAWEWTPPGSWEESAKERSDAAKDSREQTALLKALIDEQRAANAAIAANTLKSAKRLDRIAMASGESN